jgi:hypothetical protein
MTFDSSSKAATTGRGFRPVYYLSTTTVENQQHLSPAGTATTRGKWLRTVLGLQVLHRLKDRVKELLNVSFFKA